MGLFVVSFSLSGKVTVDCDDEVDARDYINSLSLEELQRAIYLSNSADEVEITASSTMKMDFNHQEV